MDKEAPIYDEMIARLEEQGLTLLDHRPFRRISLASAYITKNPNLARSFVGGYPEISIFWIHDGIRKRARLDYTRILLDKTGGNPVRVASVTDLKSFSSSKLDEPLEQAITDTAVRHRLQAKHYMEGWSYLRQHIKNGSIFGEHDEEWVKRAAQTRRIVFSFVFYRSQGAPFADARHYSEANPLLKQAAAEIEKELFIFRQYYEAFGQGGPWVSLEPPREVSQEEASGYALR
jgi:hypothetical protein